MASKSKKAGARPKKSTSTLPQVDWVLIFKVVSGVGIALLAWVVGSWTVQKVKPAPPGPVYKCVDPDDGFSTVFCGKHLMAMKAQDDPNVLLVKTSKPSAFDRKSGFAQTMVNTATRTSLLPVYDEIVSNITDRSAQRVLVLGLGGATVPLMLTDRCPDCEIVAVDLYADALAISRKFVLADDGNKVKYVQADAKRYVADAATDSFDVVVCDVAQGAYLPEFLFSDEFIGNVKRIMRDDALSFTSVVAPEGSTDRFIRMFMALRKAFPSVNLGSAGEFKSTFLFVSSKIEPPQPEINDDDDEPVEESDEAISQADQPSDESSGPHLSDQKEHSVNPVSSEVSE